MFQYEAEPWDVASMAELLALARSMEQEAIDGYVALSSRMRELGRPELAAVFDALVSEEEGHLNNVDNWQNALGQVATPLPVHPPEELFDDEGAGIVAPELLSAYRAFSMAVRNEERAFVFWTYVAAHANSDEIRQASERMAREELGHVAKLRRERRQAFHRERSTALNISEADLPQLEKRLARHLHSMAAAAQASERARWQELGEQADDRARSVAEHAFGTAFRPEKPPQNALENALPLCEFLTDCYLDLAERSNDEQDAGRARAFAAEVIHCLRLVRGTVARRP